MVERYVPSIGMPNWNIREMDKKEREQLKKRLRIALLTEEEEYQRVLSYLHMKFPQEMDGLPWDGHDNVAVQWRYAPARNKQMVHNHKIGKDHDMYAMVVYDAERNMEPVAVAGSYFKLGRMMEDGVEWNDDLVKKYACNPNGDLDQSGGWQRYGVGYVMFVDSAYRRLNLGTELWWAEAKLYVEALAMRFQREIQNTYSLKSTQGMFSDPSHCVITSPGRLKLDGTRCQIRCMLDYEDPALLNGFENMLPGLKDIYAEPDWSFLEREHLDDVELLKPWTVD